MSNFLNKIPVSPITSFGNPSVPNGSTIGTNFSILQTGGYMEVYSLSGLTYIIPPATTGIIEFSGNSIPIQFTKGSGSAFSPDVLTLNSDNISSGRRKLGMLAYVYETNKIYQFRIDNYDTLWNNATGATGLGGPTVVISDYGTTVKNNSAAGIAFINAWTASTISGIGGYNDTNASWRVLSTGGSSSGGTFTGGTVTGATIFTNGLTANTFSAGTYYNLPVSGVTGGTGISASSLNGLVTIVNTLPDQTVTITGGTNIGINGTYPNFGINFTGSTGASGDFLPLSGGTVTGKTIFTSGLTANTISATTYYNLPVSGITGGTGISASSLNGLVTIVNTSPDQIVSISGGTGIQTGGTYPNFVITNTLPDQTVTITGGTNIKIDGTYPNFGVSVTGVTELFNNYLPLSGGTVTGATSFTGGLTANTISATNYLNLPKDVFVTGGTYTSGNAIFTNNTGGTFTVTGFAVGGGGGQTFYLNLSESEGSNRLLSTTASTSSEQTTGVTISSGVTSSIASFQSQPLNTTLLPGGVWGFYLHSYKEDTNSSFSIFVEVYKRTSGGTQTLLFTTDSEPVTTNSPNPSMQLSDGYFSGTPLVTSDSIVAVVRATNTGNQTKIITLVTEGTSHYSYAVSTIPTQQGLTCDTLSGCSIIQTIQSNISNKLDKSGGTITGNLTINSGLTANTISATTYQNLPATPFLPLSGGTLTGPLVIQTDFNPFSLTTTNYSPGSAGNVLFYGVFTGSTNGFSINSRRNGGASSSNLILQASGNGNVGVNKSTSDTLNYNLDVSGSFGATSVSATTYLNLPTDIRVTGGTYSNGTATFTNNTGGTFNVTGLYTGGTDVFVTGATKSGNVATFTNNTGGTFTLTGLTDTFVTGGTYDTGSSSITFTNNSGGTFSVTGITSSGGGTFTGGTVTGATNFTGGLTANTISATTYQNLPTDIRVTGGTYSGSTIIFTNNTGGTFSVTGITSSGGGSFTGGTVSGATEFTGGLTANTISATTITSPSISPYGLIVATSIGYQNIF